MNRFLRCTGFLFVWVFLTAFSFRTIADSPRPDLTGRVLSGEDSPLQGATVFIYTAGPREGVGILCPSCYADCTKKSTTDAEGHFTIQDLDPSLLLNVLVVAKGHQPQIVEKVDPVKIQ